MRVKVREGARSEVKAGKVLSVNRNMCVTDWQQMIDLGVQELVEMISINKKGKTKVKVLSQKTIFFIRFWKNSDEVFFKVHSLTTPRFSVPVSYRTRADM